MRRRFTTGLITGGIITAAVMSFMAPTMNKRTRKKVLRNGRGVIRSAGQLVDNVVDILR